MPIRRFDAVRDTDHVVSLLAAVSQADPHYPPRVDAVVDKASRKAWLSVEGELGRWVVEINGRIVGHVLLKEPGDYLKDHLYRSAISASTGYTFAEIAKLFADPTFARQGVGRLLLATAREFAWSNARQPALAVLSTSRKARGLYTSTGMIEVDGFEGRHGQNLVFIDASSL